MFKWSNDSSTQARKRHRRQGTATATTYLHRQSQWPAVAHPARLYSESRQRWMHLEGWVMSCCCDASGIGMIATGLCWTSSRHSQPGGSPSIPRMEETIGNAPVLAAEESTTAETRTVGFIFVDVIRACWCCSAFLFCSSVPPKNSRRYQCLSCFFLAKGWKCEVGILEIPRGTSSRSEL